jgi:hypothetical protein
MDKRQFTRVPYRARVTISKGDGEPGQGETGNISLRGMYLEGFQDVPLGQEVEVEISLTDGPESRYLKTKAVAVRYNEGGTGFHFGAMDFDTFFALQEIVVRVSGTPGQVMTEVMKFINNG